MPKIMKDDWQQARQSYCNNEKANFWPTL